MTNQGLIIFLRADARVAGFSEAATQHGVLSCGQESRSANALRFLALPFGKTHIFPPAPKRVTSCKKGPCGPRNDITFNAAAACSKRQSGSLFFSAWGFLHVCFQPASKCFGSDPYEPHMSQLSGTVMKPCDSIRGTCCPLFPCFPYMAPYLCLMWRAHTSLFAGCRIHPSARPGAAGSGCCSSSAP